MRWENQLKKIRLKSISLKTMQSATSYNDAVGFNFVLDQSISGSMESSLWQITIIYEIYNKNIIQIKNAHLESRFLIIIKLHNYEAYVYLWISMALTRTTKKRFNSGYFKRQKQNLFKNFWISFVFFNIARMLYLRI